MHRRAVIPAVLNLRNTHKQAELRAGGNQSVVFGGKRTPQFLAVSSFILALPLDAGMLDRSHRQAVCGRDCGGKGAISWVPKCLVTSWSVEFARSHVTFLEPLGVRGVQRSFPSWK